MFICNKSQIAWNVTADSSNRKNVYLSIFQLQDIPFATVNSISYMEILMNGGYLKAWKIAIGYNILVLNVYVGEGKWIESLVFDH